MNIGFQIALVVLDSSKIDKYELATLRNQIADDIYNHLIQKGFAVENIDTHYGNPEMVIYITNKKEGK